MNSPKCCTTIAVLIMPFLISGCLFPVMWSKPGYVVSIETQKANEKVAHSMEDTLKGLSFVMYERRRKGDRCDLYSRPVVVEKRIEHPNIVAVVCYSLEPGADQLRELGISVNNVWDGQDPQLKKEIDSTADILSSELTKLVGKENIAVERKATGPPF